MFVAAFKHKHPQGKKKKDMGTTERIQRETELHFGVRRFLGNRCLFIGKVAQGQIKRDMMKEMHCRIWGGSLPLVIPGERWSLSLCRRLLTSREPCLAGWDCWPSNIFTMSIRSIFFRAVYKLSTEVKTHGGESRAETEKEKQGRVSRNTQQWHYSNLTLTGIKRQNEYEVMRKFTVHSCTHSWPFCPHVWPTSWAVQSSAPARSLDSPHGSYWCHPH